MPSRHKLYGVVVVSQCVRKIHYAEQALCFQSSFSSRLPRYVSRTKHTCNFQVSDSVNAGQGVRTFANAAISCSGNCASTRSLPGSL